MNSSNWFISLQDNNFARELKYYPPCGCSDMPIRGCKSSYEVMTMGLIFAAVVILVTTTTEAREIRVSKHLTPQYRVTLVF